MGVDQIGGSPVREWGISSEPKKNLQLVLFYIELNMKNKRISDEENN